MPGGEKVESSAFELTQGGVSANPLSGKLRKNKKSSFKKRGIVNGRPRES